jgi:uncharacterized repeat protein (TIGR03803 family)
MTNAGQNRGWISASRWWKVSRVLALGLVLGSPVLRTAQAPTYTVLHTFTGPDGAVPTAGLIPDAAGNLYGTTIGGGESGNGVVFKLDPTGKETVLYSFTGGADGNAPYAGVIRDSAGNLYGTTVFGGSGAGVVFKLDPTGKETVLYSFTGGADGNAPYAGVIRDSAGNLYGTTVFGGPYPANCPHPTPPQPGCGVVFKLDPTGKETVLHGFTGGLDGANPVAGLIRDSAGNLYGTTFDGGLPITGKVYRVGVVFKLDPAGKETVLHRFTVPGEGAQPAAGLIRDAAGNLYGTTSTGYGINPDGVVFKLDPAGNETVLHGFSGDAGGAIPLAGLIRDAAGNLYGTTAGGGGGFGVVFKLDPTLPPCCNETVLHYFTGGPDGGRPAAGLIRDAAGNLYGTTSGEGVTTGECGSPVPPGCGLVFKLTP